MKPIDLAHRVISSCLLSILLAAAAAGPVHAQSIVREWARVFDSGGIDRASEIDVTPAGDVYVVGIASSQDTTSLLLLHYGNDGTFRWSNQLGALVSSWKPPLLAADVDGAAVVSAYDEYDGGFAARIRESGELAWTYAVGAVTYPTALTCTESRLVYVVGDFDIPPYTPELAILTLDGEELCNEWVWNPHRTTDLSVNRDTVYLVGTGNYDPNESISMLTFDGNCQRTWFSEVGLGGWAAGATIVQLDWHTAFVGNLEIRGDMDVWVGLYNAALESQEFVTFDMNGHDDRVFAGAPHGFDGALAGSTESASVDVLVGRFDRSGDDSWWTYDGPTGGDDQGVDVGFLPTGEIVVLAQVAGALDNDQALLLYSHAGELRDVDTDTFVDNPVGLAITSTGEIYTTSYNAGDARVGAGNIIVNKYSISPGVGVASAEAPGKLRVGAPEPNPSTGSVTISYELPTGSNVRAGVYDASGRLVRTLVSGRQLSGLHQLVWDGLTETGRPAASGAYFVRFDLGNRVERRRVVLTR